MGLQIVRADISKLSADAIVNSANKKVRYGNGVDRAIYMAAGKEELLAAREIIGEIAPGDVAVTRAYNLSAKWIFHAVCPKWDDGNTGEYEMLKNCYKKSLDLAVANNCKSIAIPLIGTGVFGFPRKAALQIAVNEIMMFLLDHDMDVMLVIFDEESVRMVKRVFPDIKEFIDREDAGNIIRTEYVDENEYLDKMLKPLYMEELGDVDPRVIEYYNGIKTSLVYAINDGTEEGFGQRVLKYMEPLYQKDSDFYKAAGINRKTFYRIRDNEKYYPKKDTVWGICFALKLDMYKTEQLMKLSKHDIDLSDARDVELKRCIENKIFSIIEINEILDEKGFRILSE